MRLWLALGLACVAFAGGAAAADAPVDGARRVTGYASLPTLAGSHGAPLKVAQPAVQARALKTYDAAITYAACTDSNEFLVWRNGAVVLDKTFGPYDASSKAWSASMSKTPVALALGVAVHDGLIRSVDAPVSDYLPSWKADGRARITFRNLLEMTSGLDHPAFGADSYRKLTTADDQAAATTGLALVAAPGAEFDYNTSNVTILMAVIARVSGKPFADYLSQAIWRPIGAEDAQFAGDHKGQATPSILATAHDWMRIGILIEQGGAWNGRQFVPASWVRLMTAPSARNPNYGWLVWRGSPPGRGRSYGDKVEFKAIHSEPYITRDITYLDGYGGQRVYILGSKHTVIVRTGATRLDWDDAVLPNAVLRGDQGITQAPSACPISTAPGKPSAH